MRILLINYEFPPLGGGAGNATQNIARQLALLGHKVLVFTTWFSGCLLDETIDGYRVVRVKSKRLHVDRSNIFEMFHFAWRAIIEGRSIVKEFNPDITISFLQSHLVSLRGILKRNSGLLILCHSAGVMYLVFCQKI